MDELAAEYGRHDVANIGTDAVPVRALLEREGRHPERVRSHRPDLALEWATAIEQHAASIVAAVPELLGWPLFEYTEVTVPLPVVS